jgi:hypothetical protein
MADQEQISSGGFSKTTNFKWLAVGSSFVSWAVISLQDLNHIGELPTIHVTDEKVERSFCSKCGSSISYFQRDGDSIDITVGTMDNPSSVKPSKHIWDRKRIHWLKMDDGLPHFSEWSTGNEPIE